MTTVAARTPRLGFLGVGWIGRKRMQSLVASGAGTAAAIADPDPELRAAAAGDAPDAVKTEDLDALLASCELDGLVIATPSALHAVQAVTALDAGLPVFCQKPLGRDGEEARAVVAAAERADRLLGVDLSYRHTAAIARIREQLRAGAIGEVYALDLVFHNAYGPDRSWFKRRDLAGGGCLIDLGTHLVDLALWLTGRASAEVRSARLLRGGKRLCPSSAEVEDFALAELDMAGIVARLVCSWWLPAGRDCVVEVALYGTDGALVMRNVGGSFYDFEMHLQRGTQSVLLAQPPDDWGGRALRQWTERLAASRNFDRCAREYVAVSDVLDAIYASAS
jgi:predicted dehydrogenase